jgi:hypothetical protein
VRSDTDIPSIAGRRPDSVSSSEAAGNRRGTMPVLRPLPLATPRELPSMHQLISLVRGITGETSLRGAVSRLERDTRPLLGLTDALCVWLDWPHRVVWSIAGRASAAVQELVIAVAGSGRRTLLGNALIEPIGPPPARAVLAIRRSPGHEFDAGELTLIATLSNSIAPTLDRLIAAAR